MELYDRIIVKKNADFEKIVKWLADNDGKNIPFLPPMSEGVIEWQEEGFISTFRQNDNRLHMSVALFEFPNHEIFYFDANTDTREITDFRTAISRADGSPIPEQDRMGLALAMGKDMTIHKQLVKYIMLMQYFVHCKKYVKVSEERQLTRAESKEIRRSGVKVAPFVRTEYVVENVPKRLPKIKHRSPDHQFGVRGHYRRYKDGRVVWINSYKKCKDKAPKEKTFRL